MCTLSFLFKDGNFNTKNAAAAVKPTGEILHYEKNDEGESGKEIENKIRIIRVYALLITSWNYWSIKLHKHVIVTCNSDTVLVVFDCIHDLNEFEIKHLTNQPFRNLLKWFKITH